jgi:TPP-dependent pyruvate/acetoin dehydrogenase alpha subunit/pyruvate/2-oxoglutarate/acetoin dehydrogenase E1 component
MATFALHCESRIASLKGEGFYTIGPCGEELMGGVGLALRTNDMTALHYRHLATQLVRQIRNEDSMEQILLDRARAHVVSKNDPVTGGNHCSLGASSSDFLVTSTLASQCPPAVGRALGLGLVKHLGLEDQCIIDTDAISYVSLGDGSINNAHFLAAKNLAEYSDHRKFPCPVLFGITDNQKCISLPGHRYLESFEHQWNIPVHIVDGCDLSSVTEVTRTAAEYVRKFKRPSAIIYKNLPRRFGHAATDRQIAYMTEKQINNEMEKNPIEYAIAQAVECGATTYNELIDEFEYITNETEKAFNIAIKEDKAISNPVSIPLVPFTPRHKDLVYIDPDNIDEEENDNKSETKDVMRKLMTRFYDEVLSENANAVYIGEDVTHGGYYLVTDGLRKKHSRKVADFPPDETTLIGAGIGYSQLGLIPIVEIPYAKYLDCGADMFYEACISTWLSNGRQPNGMIIRLQGFDRGVFGGNFHTHNSLNMPPGLDVVCYSNGVDYVKGMRYALQQAKAGRIVMTVDSTALLNLRGKNTQKYPLAGHWTFDDVHIHEVDKKSKSKKCVVTYGTGVVEAMRARELGLDATIIDCPLLSDLPKNLDLSQYTDVIFFDPCKEGQNPLSGHITKLQNQKKLPKKWGLIAAPKTYNPLGQLLTFISAEQLLEHWPPNKKKEK